MNRIKKPPKYIPKESVIQKQIMDYLRIKGYVVWKNNNVGVPNNNEKWKYRKTNQIGISDIIACQPTTGLMVCIEVKRPGGTKPTDMQLQFIENIKANNGIAFVAYSLDDVMKAGI